jgi:hypothetical protein
VETVSRNKASELLMRTRNSFRISSVSKHTEQMFGGNLSSEEALKKENVINNRKMQRPHTSMSAQSISMLATRTSPENVSNIFWQAITDCKQIRQIICSFFAVDIFFQTANEKSPQRGISDKATLLQEAVQNRFRFR